MLAYETKKFAVDNLNVLDRVDIKVQESPLFSGILASIGTGKSTEKKGGLEKQLECLSETLEEVSLCC
jgi:hypothetical protein